MEEDCPICLEPCTNNIFISSCCKNKFHNICYQKCLNINNTCPTCRSVIVNIDDEELVQVKNSYFNYCLLVILSCKIIFIFIFIVGFMAIIIYCIVTKEIIQSTNGKYNSTNVLKL